MGTAGPVIIPFSAPAEVWGRPATTGDRGPRSAAARGHPCGTTCNVHTRGIRGRRRPRPGRPWWRPHRRHGAGRPCLARFVDGSEARRYRRAPYVQGSGSGCLRSAGGGGRVRRARAGIRRPARAGRCGHPLLRHPRHAHGEGREAARSGGSNGLGHDLRQPRARTRSRSASTSCSSRAARPPGTSTAARPASQARSSSRSRRPGAIDTNVGDVQWLGTAQASKATIAALVSSPTKYYVNVHTKKFPNGAVRGQLGAWKSVQGRRPGRRRVRRWPDRRPRSRVESRRRRRQRRSALGARLAATLRPGDVVARRRRARRRQDDVRPRRVPRARRRGAGVEPDVHDRPPLRGAACRSRISTSTASNGLGPEEWGDLEPYFDGTIAFVEWPEHARRLVAAGAGDR